LLALDWIDKIMHARSFQNKTASLFSVWPTRSKLHWFVTLYTTCDEVECRDMWFGSLTHSGLSARSPSFESSCAEKVRELLLEVHGSTSDCL
jgi:hypothetical protein